MIKLLRWFKRLFIRRTEKEEILNLVSDVGNYSLQMRRDIVPCIESIVRIKDSLDWSCYAGRLKVLDKELIVRHLEPVEESLKKISHSLDHLSLTLEQHYGIEENDND